MSTVLQQGDVRLVEVQKVPEAAEPAETRVLGGRSNVHELHGDITTRRDGERVYVVVGAGGGSLRHVTQAGGEERGHGRLELVAGRTYATEGWHEWDPWSHEARVVSD